MGCCWSLICCLSCCAGLFLAVLLLSLLSLHALTEKCKHTVAAVLTHITYCNCCAGGCVYCAVLCVCIIPPTQLFLKRSAKRVRMWGDKPVYRLSDFGVQVREGGVQGCQHTPQGRTDNNPEQQQCG